MRILVINPNTTAKLKALRFSKMSRFFENV
jgi:Asp/Glu/hydantoin racemase